MPVAKLKEPIRGVLQNQTPVVEEQVEAVTRTGRAVRMRVRTLSLRRGQEQPYGAILLMTSDGETLAGG